MADNSNGWSIPWPTLAMLAAAIGGAFYLLPSLDSSRPASPGPIQGDALGYQDVDARLWQDPFQAAYEHRRVLHDTIGPLPIMSPAPAPADSTTQSKPAPAAQLAWDVARELEAHRSKGFLDQVANTLKRDTSGGELLILGVMVNDGPYTEYAEGRLRARQAVLSGLGESGFIPSTGEHVGYFEIPWAWMAPQPLTNDPIDYGNIRKQALEGAATGQTLSIPLVVPYEWCDRNPLSPTTLPVKDTKPLNRVALLWLREEAFAESPLARLGGLVRSVRNNQADSQRLRFRVIGPRTSTTLRTMTEEAQRGLSSDTVDALKDVELLAATPTAADPLLLYPLSEQTNGQDIRHADAKTVKEFIEKSASTEGRGLQLWRNIHTEDALVRELIDELDIRRGLNIRRSKDKSGSEPTASVPEKKSDSSKIDESLAHDNVALIAEWDTVYGRGLLYSFAAEAAQRDVIEIVEDKNAWPDWIHRFTYLRGIDGRLPNSGGGGAGKDGKDDSGKGTGKEGGDKKNPSRLTAAYGSEQPEGLDQTDYLRRLVRELELMDRDLTRETGKGLRAVGVLGTDLFDKLLILRALRDRLPGVVFFTTNLDARMELPSEWQPAHNLVVASSFGFSLSTRYQGTIPPFRDGYQTSIFCSTLVATGRLTPDTVAKLIRRPRIFEIGRQGARDLSVGLPGLHRPRPDAAEWWTAYRTGWAAGGFVIVAAALVWASLTWIKLGRLRFVGFVSNFTPFLVLSSLVIGISVWAVYCQQWEDGEPWALFSGISIWPTEILRLLAGFLTIHFFVKSEVDRLKNDDEIVRQFGLHCSRDADTEEPGTWREKLSLLRERWAFNTWKVTAEPRSHAGTRKQEVGQKDHVDANLLWNEYRCRGSAGARAWRVIVVAAGYYAAGYCLMSIFGFPTPPARGDMARTFDYVVSYVFSVPFAVLLTFYVIDATVLNHAFIKHLASGETDWPPKAYDQCKERGIDRNDLGEYLDIRIIAQRTKVVGTLIYYPFLILFLIIGSRNSYFDNWDWPFPLVLLLGTNTLCALIGAYVLRQAAEAARRHALARLHDRLIGHIACKRNEKADAVREIIREVEGERGGAFSVLSQYPILAAILLPSGGIGIWFLLEYLSKTLR